MKRIKTPPRPNWQQLVERDGLVYRDTTSPTGQVFSYWTEDSCYEVTESQTKTLAAACNTLTQMFIAAGDYIIENNLFRKLSIPDWAASTIVTTWQDDDPAQYWPSLYGRFDLWWNGSDPPKLYEYNADTPTAFCESTAVQWNWLIENTAHQGYDQWNNAFETLVTGWRDEMAEYQKRTGRKVNTVHLAYSMEDDSGEDQMNLTAIADAAAQAGFHVKIIHMEDIKCQMPENNIALLGLTPVRTGRFFDQDGQYIEVLFKLYPWEWMLQETFGKTALWSPQQPDGTLIIEPPYKMLWSNKGILPILWKLFKHDPKHSQYLLPAYFSGEAPEGFKNNSVEKPLLSREGANLTIRENGHIVTSTQGRYGHEGSILQALKPLPAFKEGDEIRHPVTCVWMIQNEAAGLCFRESTGLVTDNQSRFVPHRVARGT